MQTYVTTRAALAVTLLVAWLPASAHATTGLISASGLRMDAPANADMTSSWTGASVAAAGDVNGDGLADMIVGAPFLQTSSSEIGAAFVIYGTTDPKPLDLAALTPAQGFRIDGAPQLEDAQHNNRTNGQFVSGAGDVNGDGRDDIVIGAPGNLGRSGHAYIVYGPAAPVTAPIDLTALTAAQGVVITGASGTEAGVSVAAGGDVNGDGHPDVLVGVPLPTYADSTYVIYGGASLPATIDLSTLQPSRGFRIMSPTTLDDQDQWTGLAQDGIGDLNGDGRDDLVVSAPGNTNSSDSPGAVYVVYGPAGNTTSSISLGALTPAQGFAIDAPTTPDQSFGRSLAGVGDVNGDGRPDILIGQLSSVGIMSGSCYLIYGPAGTVNTPIQASTLTSAQGFRIADTRGSGACNAVGTAGDQNGDGIADLLIGEQGRATNGKDSGAAFVLYGSRAARGPVALDTLADADGYRLDGAAGDHVGSGVAGVGDVDGDGRPDIVIGARTATGTTGPGTAYLVLGTGPLPAPPPAPAPTPAPVSEPTPASPPLGDLSTPPISTPPATSPAKVGRARVTAKTIRVDRRGHATIVVTCPSGTAPCTGSLSLRRGKEVFLKAKSFRIAAGKTAKVSLTFSAKARKALRARHGHRLALTLVLAGRAQAIELI
jgi:hypothetical protein